MKITDGVKILSHYRDMKEYRQGNDVNISTKIHLKKGCYIGSNAIILASVSEIGENSLIGAGAVVTKDVPANVLFAGNPAKLVKKIEFE